MNFPQLMKIFLRVFAAALCTVAGIALADDFKSMTIASGVTADLPRVHGGQFMVIRNFTQENGFIRGNVTATKPPSGTSVKVLSAAILTALPPDVINTVIIAGPADVSATCGITSGNCFISFKKDGN